MKRATNGCSGCSETAVPLVHYALLVCSYDELGTQADARFEPPPLTCREIGRHNRTWRDVRLESVMRFKADIDRSARRPR